MEHRYDTVIIGAGPAGLSCALSLRKRKESVCVIDKATFPRHKTCAGLVTYKTYRLIELLFGDKDISSLFCDTAGTASMYRRSERLVTAPLHREVRLVNRVTFDNALAEEYKSMGGVMREGERDFSVDDRNKTLTLSNGDIIHYHYLIYSDGSLSISHKMGALDKSDLAFGLEVYIPSEKLSIDGVNLFFDYLDDGYSWAFPHKDEVCIGIAERYRKGKDYKKILTDILCDLKVDTDGLHFIGAFLPYGRAYPQEKLPDHVMLLGDAAGLADPITGEGLYMALRSGIFASSSLSNPHPKRSYLKKIQPFLRIVKEGRKVQKFFYTPSVTKMFYERVKDNDRAVSFFFEQMVDEYRYPYSDMRRLYRDYQKTKKNH